MGETETDTTKRKVANHILLDASNPPNEVDSEELATGFRYHHIASGHSFEWQSGMPAGDMRTMLAIFGAKTLATNEASQVRQKEGDTGDQVGAIRERFALLETGKWVDRTREGPRVDLDKMAEAAANVLVANGKVPNEPAAITARVAALRKALDDPKMVAQIRQVEGVAAEYAKLVGKATKTADDLLAMIS
jgi:hypothetical protein